MRKELLNKANFAWLVLSVVSFVVLTILMKVGIIGSYYSITLYNIFINIILAVSLNLVIGVCGQFSLGHAGFMCIGAYCAGIMVKMIPNMTGLVIGVLIGFVLSTIVALIVSIPTLRLKGDYLAIATLGFAEIVRILVQNMEITNGAAGLNGIPKLTTFPLLFVCAVISILVVCNFTHSAPGRACLSIREDEIASEAMGINTTKYKVIAFVIGALLASLAGALFAILVMVVFGGMGSMTSSVLAAVAIGIINVVLANFSEIRMIIYGLALVGIMIFKPTGILGTKELSFKKLFDKRKEKSA